ncbi:hypothetical protein [Streptomyces sp. NPDC057496]|uniref:hypothetical protein n=1 Tax=Streptomyces sp. NPDC057496 TaxID=3346149 RepID=UPI0036CDDA90
MTSHTRRRVLRGAALAAAVGAVGGHGLGHCATGARAATLGTAGGSSGGESFPFLEGAFAPVTEELTDVHLPGRVPLGFHGSWVPDV